MTTTIQFKDASVGTSDGVEYLMIPLDGYESKVKARKFVAEAQDKPYVVELKRYYRKRSRDANSYFWVLAGKLAAVLRIPKEEIYRGYIEDIGDNFEIVEIRDEAKAAWVRNWSGRGLGWVCEDLGPSVTPGKSSIICYDGSSVYNTRQMSCLIDLIVHDCKEQGIETLSLDEIYRLKELWGERADESPSDTKAG
ncbi:MAG: hypothetical protein FWE08_03620 [Oscillospiraceae bacterium]|nr:hypothetical protein [Oscillospiraceae bacterium]